MQPFLADPSLKPGEDRIALATNMFGELMRIRYSSELFRLGTEGDVQARLAFLNNGPDQLPGLVVMTLSDQLDPDLDMNYEKIVVLINANDEAQTFADAEMAGMKLALHPVQRASADPVVRNAGFNSTTGAFSIPARTAAVFVAYEAPTTRIMHLIEAIQALVDDGVLNTGQGNSLMVKLQAAIQSLNKGNINAASNQLAAFTQEVGALLKAGVLSVEQAQPLIDAAMDIIYQIRGGF